MQATTTRAAIYCRVSSEEQAASGLGLESQESRCRAFCEAKGFEVAGVYVDAGVSGTVDPEKRPEAARMLRDAREGRLDAVVVLKLDRLARKAEHALRVTRELEAAGVGFSSVTEPFDTTSASGRLFFAMLASFAEFERDMIADRTRAALAAKRARGERLGAVPVEASENGREAAKVARELRSMGLALTAIADRLNASGYRAKRSAFSPSTVRRMLIRAA
jgi:site-specific DNA recombinase